MNCSIVILKFLKDDLDGVEGKMFSVTEYSFISHCAKSLTALIFKLSNLLCAKVYEIMHY